MKYFFDTEFIEDGVTIDLLSIGVVCEDGREFYAQNRDANLDAASDWVRDNVFPALRDCPDDQLLHKDELRDALFHFVNYTHLTTGGADKPEFWAYYGDYDWVVLCQLFGTMMDLPEGWPMFAMDVKQLAVSLGSPELPPQDSAEHNALNDARWTRDAWKFLALPVLETPPCDHIIQLGFHGAIQMTPETCHWCHPALRQQTGAPVEPVPAPQLNERERVHYLLSAHTTIDYDIEGLLDLIVSAPVPTPPTTDSTEISSGLVPAPRLEWVDWGRSFESLDMAGEDTPWSLHRGREGTLGGDTWTLMCGDTILTLCPDIEYLKDKAEKLQAVLSPPVGTQP